MKKRHVLLPVLAVPALAGGLLAAKLAVPTDAERAFSAGMEHVRALVAADASEAPRTFSGDLELVKSDGLPKEMRGVKLHVALQTPDHLRVSTLVGKEPFELGRDGQELWIWEPGKGFGVLGAPGVQRFRTAPDNVDTTKLGALALPIPRTYLTLGRLALNIDPLPAENLAGTACRVVRAHPRAITQRTLGVSQVALTMWLRESDSFPVRIGYSDGKAVDVTLEIREPTLGQPLNPEAWKIPVPSGANVEHVALGHLTRFLDALPRALNAKVPTLGPATGEKKLIAQHGLGRLEEHDGTRVLFLRGTPEQMGGQHGTLMREQVRDLVSRVLYGVGVGSSFGKGKWFFGEIEACQERIGRYLDPRHLREMDAIASAAGLEKEEIRLANFFPELFHCSGFALTGEATTGGRIFHGRILDYMKGIGLEGNALVTVNQPDDAIAWVNIGYAGFTGSVTAMNAQHISIGEMGGRGEGNWDGKPMAQLVREVMERASTLDEAIEIMRQGPRTCEYYYVIADGKTKQAVGIKATPDIFEVVHPGEAHPQLETPVKDTVLLSAGDRYRELVKRVQAGFGTFDAESARELMTRPVCMTSNIHSALFAPDTLDFWVANADSKNVASHTRFTQYNLGDLLRAPGAAARND